MKILEYDPQIKVIWATPNPTEVIGLACDVTQKGMFSNGKDATPKLIKFLYQASHGSPLEHAVICLEISQISRACADQLRTHRIASPTMSSTHYQDHSHNTHRVAKELVDNPYAIVAIKKAMAMYETLIETGYPKEEARQILPLSVEVKYLLTINARSLAHMLKTRLCYRNTIETILCAQAIYGKAYDWFPELFEHVHTVCVNDKCKEGIMCCDYEDVHNKLGKYGEVNESKVE